MNKYVLPAITFAAGAAIGATAAWITAKKIYEKIADEEIEEMREYFWDKLDEMEDLDEEAKDVVEMQGFEVE